MVDDLAGVDISVVARLLAERPRADMAMALLGGRALSAGELARAAGLSPSAASAHLARLESGGVVLAEAQGRQRIFRLAGPAYAAVIEAMLAVAPRRPAHSLSADRRSEHLRRARSCYDHLAGALAVACYDRLFDAGYLHDAGQGRPEVTDAGARWFCGLGVPVDDLAARRRPLTRACMDWTERRYHLAGALGAALLTHLLEIGAVARRPGCRALTVTGGDTELLDRLLPFADRASAPVGE
jgi:DNA-binding transcriptional ArsR family regulator